MSEGYAVFAVHASALGKFGPSDRLLAEWGTPSALLRKASASVCAFTSVNAWSAYI